MARVLIVDDEPDILLMIRMNLEAEGHRCVLAADGQMALERVDEEQFDLLLLDVMMPVMDGWSVLERLQARDGAPPVVIVSAKSAPRDARRALELGAVEYVTKPFDMPVLVRLVDEVCELAPADREERRLRSLAGMRAT